MGSRGYGSTVSHILAEKSFADVGGLLRDLARLMDHRESADLLFLLGREETPIHAHQAIMIARCTSFQNLKRGEIFHMPGGAPVSASSQAAPIPIRLPHHQPQHFRNILSYIYTGKALLSEGTVMEMLWLAQDLGLEDLKKMCEDFLSSGLTVQNACTLLGAALEFEERAGSAIAVPVPGFTEKVVAFIGENAAECVQTTGFLRLAKPALIRLVVSDQFALEEEDVWRCVLSWAKGQAGIPANSPPSMWGDEERRRIGVALSGVVNHVRLLLIDSQVFAEEVEPTGVVPIEVSLERYRLAALPNKFSEDKRLQPRQTIRFFANSHILNHDKAHFQRILNTWYGVPNQTWRCIYRASSHGFSADAFHQHCDGVAPTFVIVMGTQGEVCGGFSDVPWGQTGIKGRYVASNRAFLFSLTNPQLPQRPARYDIVKKMFAICYHPDCGPIFGAGADLLIASHCNTNMESYSNLPHSYDGENASSTSLMGNYNFSVLDYEVFTVTDAT